MLTRFVRIQLIIFTIASIVGTAVMVAVYMQAPTVVGIGRITVQLNLPDTGGLYRFSNVTYRGVEVGKVTDVQPTRDGAVATLSLSTSPRIPADLTANVRSISAIGEQYVDLQPRNASGPYLDDGSVIALKDSTVPQAVGPVLDQLSALIGSFPKDKIPGLLDESFKAFNGTGPALGSLADSSSALTAKLNGAADQLRSLVDDSRPLLEGQAQSTDAIRTWTRSLAGISDQVVRNDPQVRTLLETGAPAADEASRLLTQIKPTLPILLANLTTIGQIAVTYHPSLQQLLILLPPSVAAGQASGLPTKNPTGMSLGDFSLTVSDPPACSVGFLPQSSWRSPADLSDIETPDGLYCKLPQDSPIGVRGVRNFPCMGVPGKRAPTVEICNSDKPYEPLALRQHALGPNPIDPSLIAQGIPPDDRVDFSDQLYGPVQGTPLPPGAEAAPAAAPPSDAPPVEAPSPDGGVPAVAPSGFSAGGSQGPSVAIATYDPQTGRYATPDGAVFQQQDVVNPGAVKSWKDFLPTT